MKKIKVRFNNVWDDDGVCEDYEIFIFYIPDELDVDIEKEVDILYECYIILNDYDCDDEENLTEILHDYYDVTVEDLNIAIHTLNNGDSGLIAERIAIFISEKYPGVTYEVPDCSCDLVIDID